MHRGRQHNHPRGVPFHIYFKLAVIPALRQNLVRTSCLFTMLLFSQTRDSVDYHI